MTQTSGGALMDVQNLKKVALKDESSVNSFPIDGEGYWFSKNAENFKDLGVGDSSYGWKTVGAGYGSLVGGAPTDCVLSDVFTGDGVLKSFTGGTVAVGVRKQPLSLFGVFAFGNRAWSANSDTRQEITGRVVAEGDGATLSYSFYVGTSSILPSSLSLIHTEGGNQRTGTDNGGGVITGTNIASATVDYETGLIAVTFTNAPDLNVAIAVTYTVDSWLSIEHAENVGVGTGAQTVYSLLELANVYVKERSFRLKATISSAEYYFVDDGAGNLTEIGNGGMLTSGTINYTSGAVAITFASAPGDNTVISATYQRKGLNKFAITHANGTGIAARFDVEPTNGSRVLVIGQKAVATESGIGITSGLLVLGKAGVKAGIRTLAAYIDESSEAYAVPYRVMKCVPGSEYVVSFYGKTFGGTGSCYIRAWSGASGAGQQIGFLASKYDWEKLKGVVTLVDDPANPGTTCLKCSMTTTLYRFGARLRAPDGATCLSMSFEAGASSTYLGENSLWVSGIQFGLGTGLAGFSSSVATVAIARPSEVVEGQYLQFGPDGTVVSAAVAAAGGGAGGITSLNGLTSPTQTLAIGTTGTAPTFASVGGTHTLNIPLASAAGTTAGLLSKEDYDDFSQPLSVTTTTTNLAPTVVTDTNTGADTLHLPLASTSTNVTAGLISGSTLANLATLTGVKSVSSDFAVGALGVTAGNVVELVSDGVQNLQNIYHCETPTISSLLTLEGTNNISNLAMASVDSSNVIAIGRETSTSGALRTFLISAGNPPTSVMDIPSTNNASFCSIDDLSSTAFAFSYKLTGDGSGRTRLGFISGSDVTFSTESATLGAIADITTATCALTPSNYFLACADTNSDCQVYGCASNGTNAPNVSASARNVNGTNNCAYLSLARLDNDNAMLVMQNTTGSNGVMCRLHSEGASNDPSASTVSTALDDTNNCTWITQSEIDPTHTLCAYAETTTGKHKVAVIQANGAGAPTIISSVVNANNGHTYNRLTAHSSNLHTLTYKSDFDTYGYAVEVYVDSNYNITLSKPLKIYGNNATAYNAVEAITPTTAIAAFQGTGSDGFAGTLTLTPTPTISGQLLGISQDTATNGTATIDLGPVWETTNTLTLGEEYFANPAGGITTNSTPVYVGRTDTTNSVVLNLQGNPAVGLEQVWEITTPGAFTFTVPEDGEYLIEFCGGGGSGCYDGGAGEGRRPMGGNGGNSVQQIKHLVSGASIAGSIGTGGAAVTVFSNGNDGGSTTVSGIIAYGGAGGIVGSTSSTYQYTAANRPNRGGIYNILGSEGSYYYNGSRISHGGCANLFTNTQAVITSDVAGKDGSKGGGGTGSVTGALSGKGGNGVVRITFKRGSNN